MALLSSNHSQPPTTSPSLRSPRPQQLQVIPVSADSEAAAVVDRAAGIWTAAEAESLQALRGDVTAGTVRRVLTEASPEQRLRVCAALGPMWWMNGMAAEGLESMQLALSEAADAPPPPDWPWSSLLPRDERASLGVDVGALVPSAWESRWEQTAKGARRGELEAAFLAQGTPQALLTACCLDGGGANAYATSSYALAAELHGKAYAMAQMDDSGRGGAEACDAAVVQSRALDGLGRVARETGEYVQAFQLHVAAAQRLLDMPPAGFQSRMRPSPLVCVANAISNAGVAAYRADERAQSKACHSLAKRLRESSGDKRGYSSSLGNLAKMSEAAEALPLYEESLRIREELRDTWGIAGSHRAIAAILVKRGDVDEATAHLAKAIPGFVQVEDQLGVAESLETLGLVWHARSPGDAAKLLGASLAVRKSIGAALDVVERHEGSQDAAAAACRRVARGPGHVDGSDDTAAEVARRERQRARHARAGHHRTMSSSEGAGQH